MEPATALPPPAAPGMRASFDHSVATSPASTPSPRPHITVCVCTYRRPQLLRRLLDSLLKLSPSAPFTFSVVVADNDAAQSAEETVRAFSAQAPFPVVYGVEPEQNIALVRNRALSLATGDFVAFIDDDEFPDPDWLIQLHATCEQTGASGVLGPVRPHFDQPPPDWIVKGRLCDRPEHPTGTVLRWSQGRTGNVLFRRAILPDLDPPFRAEFGTGGEDQDFYRRAMECGAKFTWCNEAIVYETVPPSRCRRRYMLKRALLRGRNSLKHARGRGAMIAKSLVAVPLYLLSLPVSLLRGHHRFMQTSVRLCDHLGRILTILRINPVSERDM